MDSVLVLDTETTLINKDFSIFHTKPEYIMGGSLLLHPTIPSIVRVYQSKRSQLEQALAAKKMIVGHNIIYDMEMLCCDPRTDVLLWDTALYTYLASGQVERWPSLEKSLIWWGLGHLSKEDEVSKAIKDGVCPSMMDKNSLYKYLVRDVEITSELFKVQRDHFADHTTQQFRNLVIQLMKYLKVTWNMSVNGLRVNVEAAQTYASKLRTELEHYENLLKVFMAEYLPSDIKATISPSSPQQIKLILSGGLCTTVNKVPIGKYKTGKRAGEIKYKNIEGRTKVYGFIDGLDLSTSEADLKKWSSKVTSIEQLNFIDYLVKYRSLAKDVKTYYTGYMAHCNDHGYIKPQYNHLVTPTGRISCSKPNLMNLPK